MVKTNYHTHHHLCNHANGNVEDYVKQAILYGFEEIGISDHNPVPKGAMSEEELHRNWLQRYMQLNEFYDIYLKELDEAISKYGNQISILKGLETEYISGYENYYKELRSHLDYMLVGLHFFIDDKGSIKNSYSDVTYETVIEYARYAVKAMQSNLYEMLVHPDLFMFAYKDVNGERKFDSYCEKASRIIIEGAIKNNVYLEINANGLANSRRFASGDTWLYPDLNFWKIVSEYKDVKVLVCSDAHDPADLVSDDLNACIKMAKDLGIKVYEKLENRSSN